MTTRRAASTTKRPYVPPNTARVLASTLGVLPGSMLAAAALARFLPLSSPTSFAWAYILWLPIWLAAGCWIATRRSGRRAWLVTLAATALLAALVFGVPR